MNVKCVECGKEYLLSDNDNPESFQCDCGGDLQFTTTLEREGNSQPDEETRDILKKGIVITIVAVILSFFLSSNLLIVLLLVWAYIGLLLLKKGKRG